MSICIGYIHRVDLPNHGTMHLYFGVIKLPKYKCTLPIYSLLYIIFFVFIGKRFLTQVVCIWVTGQYSQEQILYEGDGSKIGQKKNLNKYKVFVTNTLNNPTGKEFRICIGHS